MAGVTCAATEDFKIIDISSCELGLRGGDFFFCLFNFAKVAKK